LPAIDDVFDVVFLDAEKEDYERLFQLARGKVEPAGLFVADNVLSHADALGAYSRARQEDPTLESVTGPPGSRTGVVRRPLIAIVRATRKGGGPVNGDFQYGQRRC
jgi:hypothetical protein